MAETSPATTDPGKPLEDAGHVRGDARMIRRAIIERWPISATTRAGVVAKLIAKAQASNDTRELLAIMRALTEADKINVALTLGLQEEDPDANRPRVIKLPPWVQGIKANNLPAPKPPEG